MDKSTIIPVSEKESFFFDIPEHEATEYYWLLWHSVGMEIRKSVAKLVKLST